jgi:transposase
MRKVDLRMNELQKYEVIKKVAYGRINKNRAAVSIGVTIRTVNRLLVKYNTFGKDGFIHGNRNKKPSTSKIDTIKSEIITLYDTKYEGFNFKHFHEKLVEDEGYDVSEASIRNWLRQEGFISPKANRVTKREHKKKQIVKSYPELENSSSLKEVVELELADAHPTRERKKYMGELIQLDASEHIWFGDTKTHLHAAIDDASGKIVGLYFDTQETLNGYYKVYQQIIANYGIPYEFLTDKRTVFEYKRKNASSIDKDTFTQFSYACKRLGTHITTSS